MTIRGTSATGTAPAVIAEYSALFNEIYAACPQLATSFKALLIQHPFLLFYRPLYEALACFVAAPGIRPLFRTYSYANGDLVRVSNEAKVRGMDRFRQMDRLGYDPEHLDAHLTKLQLYTEHQKYGPQAHTAVCLAYGFLKSVLGFAVARWEESELAIGGNVKRLVPKSTRTSSVRAIRSAEIIDLAAARRERRDNHPAPPNTDTAHAVER